MVDAVFLSLLNRSYNVVGKRRREDDQGGWKIQYYPKGAIQGRLRPASSRERETALREERFISHVFYCIADESIVRGDFISPGAITIGADEFELSSSEILVEVDGIREPSTAQKHWEIDCVERQPESSEAVVYRLLESGDLYLLESGDSRLLES